jgi:hypothetical protein
VYLLTGEQNVKTHRVLKPRQASTQLCRIIRKAELTPWPKLFQNLRSTRATELAAEFPAHVAAESMGHSTVVADKHYWRVTDADFEKAVPKSAAESAATSVATSRNRRASVGTEMRKTRRL